MKFKLSLVLSLLYFSTQLAFAAPASSCLNLTGNYHCTTTFDYNDIEYQLQFQNSSCQFITLTHSEKSDLYITDGLAHRLRPLDHNYIAKWINAESAHLPLNATSPVLEITRIYANTSDRDQHLYTYYFIDKNSSQLTSMVWRDSNPKDSMETTVCTHSR